jgi:predicted transcriptional regulator
MVKRESTVSYLKFEQAGDQSFTDGPYGDYASFLKNSEAERRLLKERIAEADKGVFVSAEAMHRWIESWGTENELPPPEPDVFLKPRRS